MSKAGTVRKVQAGIMSVVLAGAIVLTGTLAWQNFSQMQRNEALDDRNPGGRVHDDFKGTETKDVYAENFTDPKNGLPVIVRIRLEEYMEIGEDAGINRTASGPSGGTITNPNRDAKPLAQSRQDPNQPADINDTDTWYIHKPNDPDDPFHKYWTWNMGGKTVYMPTFNKNKDSLSVDVNGTYVGLDGDFDEDDPYSDYTPYTLGQTVGSQDAYYDADTDNSVDEYQTMGGPAPGAGGLRKDAPGVTNPNYEAISETHTAQTTLNGLGVITMDEWLAAGKPVCNKWVWDEDGWYYWPEPIQPQTATGLLLDKINQKVAASGKSYYAINIVGQFVDCDPTSWGKANDAPDGQPSNAEGLYIDGFTKDAQALVAQAASVWVVQDVATGTERWYLPVDGETNIYKEILNDEGHTSGLICAFEDQEIKTTDDRTDVVYIEAGVKIGSGADEKDYGKYFLKPRPNAPYNEPWYRAVGLDGLLGTPDDDRLWVPAGGIFPADAVDKVADKVTVTAPAGLVELDAGKKGELEVGKTSGAFTARVTLNSNLAMSQDVTWSVAAADGSNLAPGTTITQSGVLTVDANETSQDLVITAKSKLDDRIFGTYTVNVYESSVKVTPTGASAAEVGGTLTFQAQLYHGDRLATTQPTGYTWTAYGTDGNPITAGITITPNNADHTAEVKIENSFVLNATNGTITVKAVPADGSVDASEEAGATFTVTPPTLIVVSGNDKVKAGDPATTMTATVKKADGSAYANNAVTWFLAPKNPAETLQTGTKIDPDTGELTVDANETYGLQLVITATSKVKTDVTGTKEVTVDGGKFRIDGVAFRVLKVNPTDNTALIITEDCISEEVFDSGNKHWEANPEIRQSLNTWLNAHPTLKASAVPTTTYTRQEYNSGTSDSEFKPMTDSIFLLSEADCYGTFNDRPTSDVRDYTLAKVETLFVDDADRVANYNGSAISWWLRSPCDNDLCSNLIQKAGRHSGSGRTNSEGVRPALRVRIFALPAFPPLPASVDVSGDDKIVPGAPISMSALVKMVDGSPYENNGVTWSVASKNPAKTLQTGTKIDPNTGELTVDADEEYGMVLVVTATSKAKPYASGTKEVFVNGNIRTYDNIKYKILYTDTANNRQLIIAKDILTTMAFNAVDSSSHWKDSDIRTYLNKDASDSTGFLYGKPELQGALWTESGKDGVTIYTRKAFDNTDTANGYDETIDRVFLLSEADCFGQFNGTVLTGITQDYTVPAVGQLFSTNTDRIAKGGNDWWWLRSPSYNASYVAYVNTDGTSRHVNRDFSDGGVRPACWVKINP